MAWTATLVSVTKQDRNTVARISFTDGTETIVRDVPSTTWTQASLKAHVHEQLAQLNARDAAHAAIVGLTGQSVTGEAATPSNLEAARTANRKAITLKQMHSTYADVQVRTAIQNRINTLESQLKSFMQANPEIQPEDLA